MMVNQNPRRGAPPEKPRSGGAGRRRIQGIRSIGTLHGSCVPQRGQRRDSDGSVPVLKEDMIRPNAPVVNDKFTGPVPCPSGISRSVFTAAGHFPKMPLTVSVTPSRPFRAPSPTVPKPLPRARRPSLRVPVTAYRKPVARMDRPHLYGHALHCSTMRESGQAICAFGPSDVHCVEWSLWMQTCDSSGGRFEQATARSFG